MFKLQSQLQVNILAGSPPHFIRRSQGRRSPTLDPQEALDLDLVQALYIQATSGKHQHDRCGRVCSEGLVACAPRPPAGRTRVSGACVSRSAWRGGRACERTGLGGRRPLWAQRDRVRPAAARVCQTERPACPSALQEGDSRRRRPCAERVRAPRWAFRRWGFRLKTSPRARALGGHVGCLWCVRVVNGARGCRCVHLLDHAAV